jgi:ribosomal protein S18 acetylase RimI-like enzyme
VTITYRTTLDGITSDCLVGFFVGWPSPPSPNTHLRVLAGSQVVALAVDNTTGRVVGYASALTDGVLSAYIPLLEVLPTHQGRGIGTALVRLVLDQLPGLYMTDVLCDPALQSFYARLGMTPAVGMSIRRYAHQSGPSR